MNCASTVTAVVLFAFSARFTAGSAFFPPAAAGAEPDAEAAPGGAGVPWRDGCAETVRSLPCVSMIAAGNVASLASSAAGRRAFASRKSASTAAERAVVTLHSYCLALRRRQRPASTPKRTYYERRREKERERRTT